MSAPERLPDLPPTVVNRAAELLNEGRTPADARAELVAEGADPVTAEAAVGRLLAEAVYGHAADLLNQGLTPAQVRQRLVEAGVDPEAAAAVVRDLRAGRVVDHGAGVLAKLAGAFVFVVGLGLFLGNTSGAFPTLPFAGGITMAVGAAIFWGGD